MFFCLLLAMLFCHFVPVDLLVVVVQVLRLRAPFRQSGVASFVDFSSSLALLAVMLSLFFCLLASLPPTLPCGSLLLQGSPHAPPTPQLDLRHFVIIGSR